MLSADNKEDAINRISVVALILTIQEMATHVNVLATQIVLHGDHFGKGY